jgi:peptidoglycan/LPS O-acetylase OafA/YrhL
LETHQIRQGSPPPELRALTGLRGMAATTVALAHFRPPLPYDAQVFFMWESAAVDLFFCLSGFTLSYVYSREKFQFSSYLTARVARIYPLYFVTLIAAGAVYVLPLIINPITYPARTAISDFLLQTLMMNSWPVIGSGVHWNIPAWSISVEWFCYVLLFPLLLLQKAPRATSTKLLCLVVLSAVSYELFMNYFDPRFAEFNVAKSQWSHWASLLRGVFGFTAGWIIFASFEKRDELHAFSARLSTPIWLGFVAILILWYYRLVHSQALVFLFPFVVLAATDPASVTSRLLGSKVLHFLGVISYSIYMTHAIVFILFIRAFSNPSTWPMSIYVLLIGTTFVVSIGTYFAIEMPARNAIRGLRRTVTRPTEGGRSVSVTKQYGL